MPQEWFPEIAISSFIFDVPQGVSCQVGREVAAVFLRRTNLFEAQKGKPKEQTAVFIELRCVETQLDAKS